MLRLVNHASLKRINDVVGSARRTLASKSVMRPSIALLFVYGTLKRGFCRAGVLSEQEFLGDASSEPSYRLVNCGSYPGLIESRQGRSIRGEVYRISAECLVELDEIEGVDFGLYERRPIRLQPPFDGKTVESYYYLAAPNGLPDCGDRW